MSDMVFLGARDEASAVKKLLDNHGYQTNHLLPVKQEK
jgi:hypothetical protein